MCSEKCASEHSSEVLSQTYTQKSVLVWMLHLQLEHLEQQRSLQLLVCFEDVAGWVLRRHGLKDSFPFFGSHQQWIEASPFQGTLPCTQLLFWTAEQVPHDAIPQCHHRLGLLCAAHCYLPSGAHRVRCPPPYFQLFPISSVCTQTHAHIDLCACMRA